MLNATRPGRCGVLLSGGIDSSILLVHLLRQGHYVQPFYVRAGLVWEREEMLAVVRFIRTIASPMVGKLVTFDLPLNDLYGNHWSVSGKHVPSGNTPDEAVFLPGRNALLLLKPSLWCQMNGIEHLALGPLAGNPFPDASDEFFKAFQTVIDCSGPRRLAIERPFSALNKSQVLQLGHDLPLELTFSCLAPSDGLHCGTCNKCAERQQAFRANGLEDPTRYAGEVCAVSS